MNNFEKVIGYESAKKEAVRICNMIRGRRQYEGKGIRMPKGVIICGDSGCGKTLMAECMMKEIGFKPYVLRKRGEGNLSKLIYNTFEEAKKNAPSVILLDDMDKFSNEIPEMCNSEEYTAVRSGIDDVGDLDVFVIATVNNMHKFPISLTRPGRFDLSINLECPAKEDCAKIIKSCLLNKDVSKKVNISDVALMLCGECSCADVKAIINDAAFNATLRKNKQIEASDLVNAYLRIKRDVMYGDVCSSPVTTTIHEAGHIAAAEILQPEIMAFATIRESGCSCGFVRRSKSFEDYRADIITCLAGRAAYEMQYGEADRGCTGDFEKAADILRYELTRGGMNGISLLDVSPSDSSIMSDNMKEKIGNVIHNELERYMLLAKKIFTLNYGFLCNIIDELSKKEFLLASDIKRIRKKSRITGVNID